jgi:hypothetical protein
MSAIESLEVVQSITRMSLAARLFEMMEANQSAWSPMRSPSSPVSSPFISPISFISGQRLVSSSCMLGGDTRVKCRVQVMRLESRAFNVLDRRKDLDIPARCIHTVCIR